MASMRLAKLQKVVQGRFGKHDKVIIKSCFVCGTLIKNNAFVLITVHNYVISLIFEWLDYTIKIHVF